MVGLNIPVSVEVLPESLRKISRDINGTLQGLNPEFKIDSKQLRNNIAAGLGKQLLQIEGIDPSSQKLLNDSINKFLDTKINKLTVTAKAKNDAAKGIEDAIGNVKFSKLTLKESEVRDFKEELQESVRVADFLQKKLDAAAKKLGDFKEARASTEEIGKALIQRSRGIAETERDRPTRLENLPQSGGSARAGENLKELRKLDELFAQVEVRTKEFNTHMGEATDAVNKSKKEFDDLSIEMAALKGEISLTERKIKIVGAGSEGVAEKEVTLQDALGNLANLVSRENSARRNAIGELVSNSEELRALKGVARKDAEARLQGIQESKNLRQAEKQLSAAIRTGLQVQGFEETEKLRVAEEKLSKELFKLQVQAQETLRQRAQSNRSKADKLISNIGKNIANREKARLKAINDSIKAFTEQTGEVLKGAGAQKALFAKIRKTLSAPTVAGGAGLGGAGDVGSIRGKGSLQKFGQDLDPKQLRAFESALRRINIEVDNFGRGMDATNRESGKFSDLSKKNAEAGKTFSKSLKEVGKTAFLAFKRLLLYTVISQVIFGVTRKIKEAAGALVDFELQARRLIFFEQSSLNASKGADELVKSTRTIQRTFDETIALANKLGISIGDATTALVTSARVGQQVGGAFAETVGALVRLEAGALSAEAAVTSLNAIQKQFFSNLSEFSNSAAGIAAGMSDIQRGTNLAEQSIVGIGATLANTAAQSSLNIQQLSDVVGRVGAAFASLQNTDPITLIRLVGEAASISGANVGRLSTGLKQSATLVIQNAEKIKSLTGVEVFKGGQVRGLDAIIEVLEKANEAAGTFKQRAILATLFDRRSLDVGAALASAVGRISDKTKNLSDIDKRANFVRAQTIQFLEAQEKVSESLDSAFNRLNNTVTGLAASEDLTRLFTAFVDIARLTVLEVQKIFTGLNSLAGAFKEGETILSVFANTLDFVRNNFSIFVDLFKQTPLGKFIVEQGKVIDNLVKLGIAFQKGASAGDTFKGVVSEIGNAVFNSFIFIIDQIFGIVGPAFREIGKIAGEGFTSGLSSSLESGVRGAVDKVFFGDSGASLNAAKNDGKRIGDAIIEGRNSRLKGSPIEELGKAFRGDPNTKKNQDDAKKAADIQRKGQEAFNAVKQREADLVQQNFATTLTRVPIEKKIFADLKLQAALLEKINTANLSIVERAKLREEFDLRAQGIAANQLVTSIKLQELTKERLTLEREIAIAIEQQAQELEKARSLSTSLTNLIGGQEGIELQIRFDRAILDKEISDLEQNLKNLSKIAVDTPAGTGDEDSAAASKKAFEDARAAAIKLESAQLRRIEFENSSAIKRFDLTTKSTQEQINAWKSAAGSIASAFGKAISLQKGLADIFNRAGELASQRLKTTASNINAFLERTGASIENRLAATRSQAAVQLAQLERSGRKQVAALDRVGQGETFGTEEQIEADTNRLIDALISASESAEQEIANKRREILNEEAAVRGQIAGELRSEFELRVNATRNEIAVRQRLVSQEIAILQQKVQAEQRFAQLREDQQRSFGRLLIESPQKFAETLKDFKFAKSFFRDITDVNLNGLQQIQGRLAQVLAAFGPEGVQKLAKGLENAIKFGLPQVIAGVGNAQALSIVERLVLQTPKELNKALQAQADRAREQSEEQKRIKLLQEQQRELVKKDAKLQIAQLRLAEFDGRQAVIQRNEIIALLRKELKVFETVRDNLAVLEGVAAARVAGAEGTTGIDFNAVTKSVTTGMDTSLEAFRMLFTTPLTVETPTVDTERDKITKAVKELTDTTTTTPPPPPKPTTGAPLPGTVGPDELAKKEIERLAKAAAALAAAQKAAAEAADNAAAEAAAELRRGLPQPDRGSETSTDDELRKLVEFQKAGNKLTFEQIAILQKALRDRGGVLPADPGAIRTPESDLAKEIAETLKREGFAPKVKPTLPKLDLDNLPPDAFADPELNNIPDFPNATDAAQAPAGIDELFNKRDLEEGQRRKKQQDILDGIFDKRSLDEGKSRNDEAIAQAAEAAKVAAQAAQKAAEAARAAAERIELERQEQDIRQDKLDRKFNNESPLFTDEDRAELSAVSNRLAKSISEGVNSAIANGGDVLGEKITNTINGSKIEVEIPETVIRVELDGKVTTELNGDKFFADLAIALESTGLSQEQIESIRRRIVELTKNQRDAGARVTNDASLGD